MQSDYTSSQLYSEPTMGLYSTDFAPYDGLTGDVLSENNPPPLDHGADGEDEDDDIDIDEDDDEEQARDIIDDVHVRSLGATEASSDAQKTSNVAILDNGAANADSFLLSDFTESTKPGIYDTPYLWLDYDEKLLPQTIIESNTNSLDITATTNTQAMNIAADSTISAQDTFKQELTLQELQISDSPSMLVDFLPTSASTTATTPSITTPSTGAFLPSYARQPSLIASVSPSPIQQLSLPESRLSTSSSRNSKTSHSEADFESPESESIDDLTPLPKEPIRTDEERKRRNRVYAKRSRDLKNQKYRDSMEKSKTLEQRLAQTSKENLELKMKNQSLEFRIKELEHMLQLRGAVGDDKLDLSHSHFHVCSHTHGDVKSEM